MDTVTPQCGLPDEAEWPDSCNINWYQDHQAGVPRHNDREALFDGANKEMTIVSPSLGATRTFQLLPMKGAEPLCAGALDAGDLVAMERWTQYYLKHAVPEDRAHPCGMRINLTWRRIAKHTKGCTRRKITPEAVPLAYLPVPMEEGPDPGGAVKREN